MCTMCTAMHWLHRYQQKLETFCISIVQVSISKYFEVSIMTKTTPEGFTVFTIAVISTVLNPSGADDVHQTDVVSR